jgi:hypothetical protein
MGLLSVLHGVLYVSAELQTVVSDTELWTTEQDPATQSTR